MKAISSFIYGEQQEVMTHPTLLMHNITMCCALIIKEEESTNNHFQNSHVCGQTSYAHYITYQIHLLSIYQLMFIVVSYMIMSIYCMFYIMSHSLHSCVILSLIRRVNAAVSWVINCVKGIFFNPFKRPDQNRHSNSHDSIHFQYTVA